MPPLSKNLSSFLNKQIEREFKAANSYFYVSNWCNIENYPGFASYFMKESVKEQSHGKEINDFLLKRGVFPEIFPFKDMYEVKFTRKSPLEVFSFYAEREKSNLSSLNELSLLAFNEKDMATVEFLNKFLKEQVESCQESEHYLHKATLYDKMPLLFYHLDHELGKK